MTYEYRMADAVKKTPEPKDTARINIRTNAEFRNKISYAAQLSGLDLTNFVISAAMRRANEVIEQQDVMRIASSEHRAAFRAALEQPGRPIPALADLLKTPSVLNATKR
ncbi:MAG: DUF1778 domain-containing protein [Rhizobiaceae bacterium]